MTENNYGTHADFYGKVLDPANTRSLEIAKSLKTAFSNHLITEEVDVIVFSDLTGSELADALYKYPLILKPLLAICNIAGRAIERDPSIKGLDTYKPKINEEASKLIAGYITPFLPNSLAIPALTYVDRTAFIDKEIRKAKGRWEILISTAVTKFSGKDFKKRKFVVNGDAFELDAAYPPTGDVLVGIDIKRVEARRDIHKRSDEIINKASKFKEVYPDSKFGVVFYYPFVTEQTNVQDRLRSKFIDSVVFAGETEASIETATKLLLGKLGVVNNEQNNA